MKPRFVRFSTLLPTLALSVLGACGTSEIGSDVLDDVNAGMPRDSVLALLGQGPLTATGNDSVRVVNGFRQMRYLRDGKMIDVIYFRKEPGDVRELVEQERETPVVLVDGKAVGWGWAFFVEAMKTYGIPTPLYEKVAPPARDSAKAGAGVGESAGTSRD